MKEGIPKDAALEYVRHEMETMRQQSQFWLETMRQSKLQDRQYSNDVRLQDRQREIDRIDKWERADKELKSRTFCFSSVIVTLIHFCLDGPDIPLEKNGAAY